VSATVLYASANELATLDATFLVDGVLTDPTAVSVAVTDPTGAVVTYTGGQITKLATGRYRIDVTCSMAGEWQYVWVGTGVATDTIAGTWTVQETTLGRLYVTPQILRSRFGINDSIDDYEVHAACFAASRSLEEYCERVFWRTLPEARVFDAEKVFRLDLPIWSELVSVTAIATDANSDGTWETTWTAADYQLLPLNPGAAPEPRSYDTIEAIGTKQFPVLTQVGQRHGRTQVTGVWGWAAVPYGIRMAAAVLASEAFRLRDAPFGIASFGEWGAIRVRANPAVAQYANPYVRYPIPAA